MGGFPEEEVAELGLDLEREGGGARVRVLRGDDEVGGDYEGGVGWGAEEADAGLQGEGKGRRGGGGGGGGVAEFEGRAGGEVGAEGEGEVGRVGGGDAGEEGETEDGYGEFGAEEEWVVDAVVVGVVVGLILDVQR